MGYDARGRDGEPAQALVQRLFIEHMDRIRGYVRAILPDADLANDVVQEVFLALSARAADYDAGRSFESWAFGFARNKVLEVARK
ncbi:MAG: polymerase sigma factor CarQ, partial [Planctomycetota bacterium]